MVTKPYISRMGFEKLSHKIQRLKHQAYNITLLLKENRENENGDESDNVEMIRLMSEREAISEKYAALEGFCATCNVVDISSLPEERDVVKFGTTIKLLDIHTETFYTYTILGDREAEPRDSVISYLSPIGMALMNESVGSIVSIDTPLGERELEVLEVFRHSPMSE